MNIGIQKIIWVRENDGGLYACFADDLEEGGLDNLLLFSIEEQSRCLDIKKLVGLKHR